MEEAEALIPKGPHLSELHQLFLYLWRQHALCRSHLFSFLCQVISAALLPQFTSFPEPKVGSSH